MNSIPKHYPSLYKSGLDTSTLKPEYTEEDSPSWFDNKYKQPIIDSVISEIDWGEVTEMVPQLRNLAEKVEYKEYYQLLNLSKADSAACPLIRTIEEKFSFLSPHIFGSIFNMMTPGQILKPHIDPIRGSAIYLPLFFADEVYAPLEIYWNNRIYGVKKEDNQSLYLWNSKLMHAVFNDVSATKRYNFQLLVNLPYSECLKLIKENIGVRYRKDALLTYDTFTYFSQYVDNWTSKSILDWGCGEGNFLRFSDNTKFHYTGCDVNKEYITKLKSEFPHQRFIVSDQKNKQYSPENLSNSMNPEVFEEYDIIIAFSVFTHMDLAEIKIAVNELRQCLKPDGKALLTFFSNERRSAWDNIVRYRYEYFNEDSKALWTNIENNEITYVFIGDENEVCMEHNKELSSCNKSDYFLSFFSPQLLERELSAKVLKNAANFRSKILNDQVCLHIEK